MTKKNLQPRPQRKGRSKAEAASDSHRDAAPHAPGLRPGSKQAQLADFMHRPSGATIDELTKALNWQPHTVRAAITGLRKRGYAVTCSKREDGTSTYQAQPPAGGAPAALGAHARG